MCRHSALPVNNQFIQRLRRSPPAINEQPERSRQPIPRSSRRDEQCDPTRRIRPADLETSEAGWQRCDSAEGQRSVSKAMNAEQWRRRGPLHKEETLPTEKSSGKQTAPQLQIITSRGKMDEYATALPDPTKRE